MKKILLTRGLFALVDDADFDWLNQWKWCALEYRPGRFYAVRVKNTKMIYMHRVVFDAVSKTEVDHENKNSLDNRRGNLRSATRSQNMSNVGLRADNTSGFKGVTWDRERQKWMAKIRVLQTHKFLGRFSSLIDAAMAYDASAIKHFGEFACVNFPNSTNKNKINKV